MHINICWFKYELRSFNDLFILRNITIIQSHIYKKQMKKKNAVFSKNEAFLYSKNSS